VAKIHFFGKRERKEKEKLCENKKNAFGAGRNA
jgi:hypothetical protein